ncbi:hypothetical protein CONLIGDRAFT_685423 [Coniochaeta ligniaria NRRL 30616]|uniref:Uncharacterized protein n=1 Tax=Coniochaeta ligniaria NRRL 30616 TaxID=1408157 RepID=A0A1J7I9U2_9PEZI|nr:hypothetical protein CONLIGDRAFT_685423 [Coniochaeta ligniaria NRRL 30616]
MPSFFSTSQTEATLFKAEYHRETERLQNQYHTNSVSEAQEFITNLIQSRWEEHLWPSIKVTCDLTMPELRDIGRMCREEGFVACRSLVRAPVIHHEVAAALWEYLAAAQGRGHGEDPDEQELFEMAVVAALAGEQGDDSVGQTCQLLPDMLRQLDSSSQTANWDADFWQRDEMICPCQKVYEDEDASETDDHGSATSAEGPEADSPSSSAPNSKRSSLSQIFMWGRRS